MTRTEIIHIWKSEKHNWLRRGSPPVWEVANIPVRYQAIDITKPMPEFVERLVFYITPTEKKGQIRVDCRDYAWVE